MAMPRAVLRAFVTVALWRGWPHVACLVLVGFVAVMRPAEFSLVTWKTLILPAGLFGYSGFALVTIDDPKTALPQVNTTAGKFISMLFVCYRFCMVQYHLQPACGPTPSRPSVTGSRGLGVRPAFLSTRPTVERAWRRVSSC